MPYLPHTKADRAAMLESIGVTSMEDLLVDIPAALRCGPLDLPPALSEPELLRELDALGRGNTLHAGARSFLGGGAYNHHIPAVVSALAARGEFVTAYTPYQPEVSQGTLQVTYEWQSLICELTGLDVSNASLYDAATACAEAMMIGVNATNRGVVVAAGTLNPEYLQVLRTYCWSQGLTLREVEAEDGHVTVEGLRDALGEDAGVTIVQSPNYFGLIEDQAALAEATHQSGALYVTCANPLSLVLLAPPGQIGADIAVGDAQPFGVPLAYGGPYAGYIAAREALLRRMPGRIVGASVDSTGRRAYVLTLQAREQHIRREKATSNICSNHALCATIATIYLSYMGKQGLREVANLCLQKAHYAAARIAALPGYGLAFDGPFFHEFAVRTPRAGAAIRDALLERGILAGIPLDGLAGIEHGLLICVTEQNGKEDIDALARGLEEVGSMILSPERAAARPNDAQGTAPAPLEPTIFELSSPGRSGHSLPACDVPHRPLDALIPPLLQRAEEARLPELSELQVVRHFTRLSQLNYSIDGGFYPLGSCTMKYNPKLHEKVAGDPHWAGLHPHQPDATVQGALEMLYRLEQFLCAVGGMDAFSLQAGGGAHGEHTGLMIIRAYHESRDEHRTEVLVPDGAHGTNPASAAAAGYKVVQVRSNAQGRVDVADLRRLVGPRTAALMLTNPNTCGLFENEIVEIARIVHASGGRLYYDGANLNAIMGATRPGDMGFDVVHFNLHKTMTTPHGGGGPGTGPVGVRAHLAPFLPVPVIERAVAEDGTARYRLTSDRPKSIGRVRGHFGNVGLLLRAYTYVRSMGPDGLTQASLDAVLNANYLKTLLKDAYDVPFPGPCMHEFVLSGKRQKRQGARTLDIAKRLLDYGYHPPTIYFPLIVDECLMIEPTETEDRVTIDHFAGALLSIARER